MRFNTAGEAKSAYTAVYDCLVLYDDKSMESTLSA